MQRFGLYPLPDWTILTTEELLGEAWMQLGHSANMVADLPLHMAADEATPKHLRHAAIDAFAVHAALIAKVLILSAWKFDYRECQRIISTVTQHCTTYGRERLTSPLFEFDVDEIKAFLLSNLLTLAEGHEPLHAVVQAAIERTEPTE